MNHGTAAVRFRRNALWVAKTSSALRLLTLHESAKGGVDGDWELQREDQAYERQDFWTTTKNEQLNLKTNPLKRTDLDDFVACYKPGRGHEREETWSGENPQGRWRSLSY